MEGFDPVQRGTVGDMTAGLPLGPWTEELAQRLKAQLEIVWQENGLKGTELEERRREVATDYAAKIAAGFGWPGSSSVAAPTEKGNVIELPKP